MVFMEDVQVENVAFDRLITTLLTFHRISLMILELSLHCYNIVPPNLGFDCSARLNNQK